MNFDELQKQWNDQKVDDLPMDTRLDKMGEANLPIDNVRRKMKKEFFTQLVCFVIILSFPLLITISEIQLLIFGVFFTFFTAFILYYFYKFFKFYKHSYNLSFNSTRNLAWFYYELKMNIELYKALTYILFFIGFSYGFVAATMVEGHTIFDGLISRYRTSSSFIVVIVVIILFSFTIAEMYPNYMYGKDLKRIKKVLDELDEY